MTDDFPPETGRGTPAFRPLRGVRVLDLTRVLAGPWCTQTLAELGADVWKVEAPGGDETRRWGPPFAGGESAYFLSTNRGKRSAVIDFRDPRGADLVRRLAERCDVVVENFKPHDLARYGLDFGSVSPSCPRLVWISITAFGPDGPRAAEPGYDLVLQALTGVMGLTGAGGGEPVKVGVAWIDILTGLYAAIAVLAALRERDGTGSGRRIELPLYDVGVASLANQIQAHLLDGVDPAPMGSAHPHIVPYQAFRGSDGWVVVAAGNDAQFGRLCTAAGCEALATDSRFATNALRVAHRAELVAAFDERFRERTTAFWLDTLRAARVPCAPVQRLSDVIADGQAHARRLVRAFVHPQLGAIPYVRSPLPVDLSETIPPPPLGAHTRDILSGVLDLDDAAIDVLAADGVVGLGTSHAM